MTLGSTVIPATASAQDALPADDRVAFRVSYSAPPGCPGAAAFEAELLARTARARSAAPDEAARIFVVDIQGGRSGSAMTGRMTVERDGKISDARVLRGKTCGEVSSALALTAALSIDPQARLVLEPVPAVENPPARQEPPPPPAPASPAPAPPPRTAPRVEVRLGAGVGLTQIVTPGVMPVVSVVGELASSGPGLLHPAIRVSLHGASNALDGGRAATFTWIAAQLDLCPLWLLLGSAVEIRPCAAAQAGTLGGVGRTVAEPVSEYGAWWSAGAAAHIAARLSSRIGVDLSGGALVPLLPHHFVFETPQRDVARTATVSEVVSLGAFATLP
jgi:hypothetical protein